MEPLSRVLIVAFVALPAHAASGCAHSSPPVSVRSEFSSVRSEFSPDRWPQQDRDRYLALQALAYSDAPQRLQKSAVSSKGMVAGTSDPFAVHAGVEILKHGGSAADAALTTALTQVVLTGGSTVSYAGMMTAVYYDASTDQTYTLNAAYNTVQKETDPATIPEIRSPSGRTALVPGFMAGVQALHDRFGRLPFAALFGPAVWVADEGVAVGPMVGNLLQAQGQFVTRLTEGRRIFAKEDGALYGQGEILRQTELARTLGHVATQGAAYMYTGEWARRFVGAIEREGGKMTLADLSAYRPEWTEPLRVPYRGYEVISLGAPNIGGLHTLTALKMAEVADLKRHGPSATSPETLYSLIQISRLQKILAFAPPAALKEAFPDIDWSPTSAVTPETAERLWAHIRGPDWHSKMLRLLNLAFAPNHSAAAVAVDERGNVASVFHTCNCNGWGSTGIFVDGVSIPDPASFQQRQIASVGAGVRLPDASNPLIVLKSGRPILASAAIGSGLHDVTLQNLISVLDFNMGPKAAVDQPNYHGPSYEMTQWGQAKLELESEMIFKGDFPEAVLNGLRARGQPLKLIDVPPFMVGTWIGIGLDVRGREMTGGVPSRLRAHVEGY
jgi:gamma-glutamyltranspeptidase/glutathione hydrolase